MIFISRASFWGSSITLVKKNITPIIKIIFSNEMLARLIHLSSGNTISLLRSPLNFVYILKQGFIKEYTVFGTTGNLLLLPADVAGGALLVRNLAELADSAFYTGSVSVLYMGAYIPIAIDCLCILFSDKTCNLCKRQACLDLANAVGQIFIATLCLISYTQPLFFAFALVAGSFGAISFLHRSLTS